ncbi:MAG: CRISPR-associated endonuclease Cas1 [Victivallales bacterium]
MPSLVLTGDTVSVNLESHHLEVVKRREDGLLNDFERMKVPLFDIDRVVVNGRASLSTPAMHALMKKGIPVFFLTSHGRWLGALWPDKNMNAERRIRQYKMSEDQVLALKIAKKLVYAKIRNSRRVLQRLSANRKESESPEQIETCDKMKNMADQALLTQSIDELRGYEGMSAALYFSRLGDFFPPEIPFRERSRQPPRDAANALLSWNYTIVLGEMDAAVRSHGLDTCIGFLHSVSHGTPALPLDLMEPLRAPVCDLLTLHLLNHKVLTKDHFEFCAEDGGTYLTQDSKKDFFWSYEMHMTRKFTPEKGGNHSDFRKIIQNSVLSVIKALEGKDDFEFFEMP